MKASAMDMALAYADLVRVVGDPPNSLSGHQASKRAWEQWHCDVTNALDNVFNIGAELRRAQKGSSNYPIR